MRWIFRLIGFVVVLAVVAVTSILLLPSERIARIAADQITQYTGRDVQITGDVSATFWPTLGVTTGAVEIGNAEWSDNGPMLRAESLEIGVDAAALWNRDIKIRTLRAVSPEVLLEVAADGRNNWTFRSSTEGSTGTSSGALPTLTLDRAEVENGSFRYLDAQAGSDTRFDDFDLALEWPVANGPVTLDLAAEPFGSRITVDAEIANVAAVIASQTTPVTAQIAAPGGALSFNGAVGTTPEAAGRIDADLSDTGRFLAAMGVSGVDVPKGFGQALNIDGLVSFKGNQVSLREGVIVADGTRLDGSADVVLAATPQITANFAAGDLDLAFLAEGGSSGGGSGWSKDRIDASGLAAFNGSIGMTAQSLDLGTLRFGSTRLKVTNDRSRAVVRFDELRGYDGNITGQFVANNRNGLSVGGDLSATGVQVQSLLADMADLDRMSGLANMQLAFLGVGQSVDAIMKSLSGDGSITMAGGQISGIDLDKLIRSGATGPGTTVFDDFRASYRINDGVLRNNDLVMTLPNVETRGEGKVDLGDREIDYLVTPIALQARDDQGLAIPFRIKGPWSSPQFLPDMGAAIDLNLEAEKKKLEEQLELERAKLEERAREEAEKARIRAEEQLRREAEKALGVETQEGESIEDALRKKLEEEAGNALRNLLGGN
ncbi:AsmA family protein [Cognatishimia sp. MH4019]|uniref:AsmA family protein n=1 Tax=Cognatishimia sp. MH4019 TaxID=2854030 RepID=UPI001CD24CB3|nr:AsmA family protein [Cognatishimia sp. MH4019]